MRNYMHRMTWRRAAMMAAGTTFFMSGCDPQLTSTVENGIITLSTSLLASVMRALIEVAQEANAQTACIINDLGMLVA